MPKDDEKEKNKGADPDDEFFKEHGVEADEDKNFLKGAYLKEKYLEHRRKVDEKKNKPTKSGLFGGRRD